MNIEERNPKVLAPMLKLFTLLLTMLLMLDPATAGEVSIKDFYGDFIGHANTVDHGQVVERDLSVHIRPGMEGGHFSIKWTTVTHKLNGKMKRKMYNVKFSPTERANIYSSAMKTNVFGGQVALDPLKGDPFVWARLMGNTLSMHVMMITDDGGYEMQVYHRTLNEQGLYLNFSRTRDGEPMKQVETQLIRVAD